MEHEFEVKKELEEKRKKIKTRDDLFAFLRDVEDNYNSGYGAAPHAIAQGALAVAWYLSGVFGITGFQAGATLWDFIRDWSFPSNKCGMKIVDYDNMLYPQYGYKFAGQTISKDVWKRLQEEAVKNIGTEFDASGAVFAHWVSIAQGVVPFNCKVEME